MMRSKIASVTLAVIGAVVLSTPVFAAVLTAYTGGGSGIPASPTGLSNSGPGGLTTYNGGSSFSFGSAVFTQDSFVADATTGGGPTPLPTPPSSVYVIGTITNQISAAGTITSAGGPGGGWGGTLGTGSALTVILGINSVPGVSFGNLLLPINAGSTATVTAMASVIANAVTVTVSGAGWTTGSITYNDTNLGTTTGGVTMAAVTNPFATLGTTTGTNNLGSTPGGDGTITLVAPITITIAKTLLRTDADLRAGYQTLKITFIPEPDTWCSSARELRASWPSAAAATASSECPQERFREVFSAYQSIVCPASARSASRKFSMAPASRGSSMW